MTTPLFTLEIINWTCQGLKNLLTIYDLYRLVRNKRHEFIFLMETKCGVQALNSVKFKLGFENVFVVNSLRRKGGLAMLWKLYNRVEVIHFQINISISKFTNLSLIFSGFFFGLCGYPKINRRKES